MEAPWVTPGSAQLTTVSGTIEGRYIDLPGVPRGAVALVCVSEDLDGFAEVAMNRLAGHGFDVTAVLLPEGDAAGLEAGARDQELAGVAESAVGRLRQRGWLDDQIGVVGLGTPGAEAALAAAIHLSIGASVSVAGEWPAERSSVFHTALSGPDAVRCPWLGLFSGGADAATHRPPPAGLADALSEHSPVFTEVILYPRVGGPLHRDSAVAAVHAAAFDAWQRTVEWLNLRVAPRPTPLAEQWRERQKSSVL